MSVQSRALLKSFFETDDYPTAEQFADLIDSFFHKNEDDVTVSPEQIRDALASLTGNNRLQAANILTDALNRFVTENQISNWDSRVTPLQVADSINALKDNVPTEGDTLKKLYDAIQTINNLLLSPDVTLDTVQEIVTFIKNNKDVIDTISTNKVDITDIIDNLLSNDIQRPLSANQGRVLKLMIDALSLVVSEKAPLVNGKIPNAYLSEFPYTHAKAPAEVTTIRQALDYIFDVGLNPAPVTTGIFDFSFDHTFN